MKHVIVFGCPRSGTTYLHRVLRRLEGVEAKIGNFIPVAIPHLVNQSIPSEHYQALCESLPRAIDIHLSGEYNSRFRALEHWWTAPDQWARLKHVVRRGRRPRPDFFVYKEPFFSLAPELVFDALPEAKVLYIYRDGRDVAHSLVSSYDVLTDQKLTDLQSPEMRFGRAYDHRYVPWWVEEGREEAFLQHSPYVRSIWMWSHMVERCRAYFDGLDGEAASRLFQVQYEDFMARPRETGARLLDHLGAAPTGAVLRQLDQAQTTSIGKYRRCPPEEIQAAEYVAGRALQRLGYL